MNFDFYLFQLINQFTGKWQILDALAIFCADYLGYLLILGLGLVCLKNYKKYCPVILQVIAAAFLSRLVITNIIRLIWERPRPFVENNVNLLLSHEPTGSFPSGHAAFYFAIAAVVYFYNKKAGILFFFASILISVSRIFAGLHWPSDIFAGALVGVFSGWTIVVLARKFSSVEKIKSQQ